MGKKKGKKKYFLEIIKKYDTELQYIRKSVEKYLLNICYYIIFFSYTCSVIYNINLTLKVKNL
jgi:hypothetical protein